jgi:hypothetical protein
MNKTSNSCIRGSKKIIRSYSSICFTINFDEERIKITGIGPSAFCFLPFNISNSTTQVSLNLVVADKNPSLCVHAKAKFFGSPYI